MEGDRLKEAQNMFTDPTQRPFRILSIDGGGIRGVIPLRILSEIERKTGQPAAHLFNLFVGNSTGGIIALALAAQDEKGRPKYSANDVLGFYCQNFATIFQHSWLRSLCTGFGLWAPRYKRAKLDRLLQTFLPSDLRLDRVVCPVVVTSYSLTTDSLSVWTSYRAQKDLSANLTLADAAGATSAAPTYFAPKKVILPNQNILHEVDGGIYANDPEAIAVTEALLQHPHIHPQQISLLSLGTGEVKLKKKVGQKLRNTGILGWLLQVNLIDLMMNADTQLEEFQTQSISHFERYRIQLHVDPKNMAMDNPDSANLEALLQVAETYLQKSESEIDRICAFLMRKPN